MKTQKKLTADQIRRIKMVLKAVGRPEEGQTRLVNFGWGVVSIPPARKGKNYERWNWINNIPQF